MKSMNTPMSEAYCKWVLQRTSLIRRWHSAKLSPLVLDVNNAHKPIKKYKKRKNAYPKCGKSSNEHNIK
jgi:hypothetical protein